MKPFAIDEKEILKRLRQRNLPSVWRVYPNPNRLLETVDTSVALALLIIVPMIVIIVVLALLHLHWQMWLLWLLVPASLLWGMASIRAGLGFMRTRLVLLPEGFVYLAPSGKPEFGAHYETLTELRMQDQQVTLVFKNGEQDTALLAVSAAALRNLQDAYQSFQLHSQK